MIKLPLSLSRGIILTFLICLNFTGRDLSAQGQTYNYFYRIFFRDKGTYIPSGFTPSQLLSERTIARRRKAGIPCPDFRDLPLFPEYIDAVKSMGYALHCKSRWNNTALFKTKSPASYNLLLNLPFIKDVKIVKQPAGKSELSDKLDFDDLKADIPPFDRQLTLINGDAIQYTGYNGKGVLIAVLDGGFLYADKISSLEGLRNRKGISATYDFVDNDKSVYESHNHGTAVMSVLAGDVKGAIEGSAPGADFILLKTEDVSSESSAEEDYWAAGAEFADSAGAEIISSSLGYYTFDDPATSYKFSDLDGDKTFVTRTADIAASKGILVVASAGNERTQAWKRIIAPSDGDTVLAVGATDGNGIISDFSSAGPSFDRRTKPDNAVMGVSVAVQVSTTGVTRSSGTSFSCPVLSGMAACLIQAVPSASNTDIIRALHEAGNMYNAPDSLYGYGIPDMIKALEILQDRLMVVPGNGAAAVPNPTTGEFNLVFKEPPEKVTAEIFNSSGKKLLTKVMDGIAGRVIRVEELREKEQGLYIIRLKTNKSTFAVKVIKLRN